MIWRPVRELNPRYGLERAASLAARRTGLKMAVPKGVEPSHPGRQPGIIAVRSQDQNWLRDHAPTVTMYAL